MSIKVTTFSYNQTQQLYSPCTPRFFRPYNVNLHPDRSKFFFRYTISQQILSLIRHYFVPPSTQTSLILPYQPVNVPNPAHRFFAIKTIGFLQIKTNQGKIEKNIKSLHKTTSRT